MQTIHVENVIMMFNHYYVNGDVAKTGDKSSIHCGF